MILARFVIHVLLRSLSLTLFFISRVPTLSLLSSFYLSESRLSLSLSLARLSTPESTPLRGGRSSRPFLTPKAAAGGQTECAVCLCAIEEGDEVPELRCRHVFHRGCLDEWVDRGRDRQKPVNWIPRRVGRPPSGKLYECR